VLALAVVALLPLWPAPGEPGGSTRPGGAAAQSGPVTGTMIGKAIGSAAADARETAAILKKAGGALGTMAQKVNKQRALNASARAHLAAGLEAARAPGGAGAQQEAQMRKVRAALDAAMKDLEAQDKLGNFEIQRLMSQYNQAATLASHVQKKLDDTISGQVQ
jgi:hypothetical protein